VRIKVCGIRRKEDAQLAAELGATAIGMIFWPGSPRYIEPTAAKPIVQSLPPFVTAVGVFVDQPVDYVHGVARLLNLGAIQLHGGEAVEAYGSIGARIIKSVPVTRTFKPEDIVFGPDAATVLLDTYDPIQRGGTGRTVDWNAAAAVAQRRITILSGGLTPENVLAAIAMVRPYAIDVSSGVESAPGVKDPARLRALFAAVRGDR
jgi:phosphoribosylanthranilate isomerase